MAEVYAPDYLRDQKDPTLHSIADMIEEQRAKLRAKDEEIARLADGGARWAQNAEHFRKEAARLKAALENLMSAHRTLFKASLFAAQMAGKTSFVEAWKDAEQALAAHSPVGNADAPAPPDTSTSCSETAGTEPTCAPTPEQIEAWIAWYNSGGRG